MDNCAYINRTASFLPNSPVINDEIEDYIGKIGGLTSRVKNIVLRQNGITSRYYALDKDQRLTHNCALLAANSIKNLFINDPKGLDALELIACATASPDQLLPSHASMVHGLLDGKPLEVFSSSGVCLSSLQALKIGMMSIVTGNSTNAVCCGAELASAYFRPQFYEPEFLPLREIGENPYMAFEKEFLRFMLSDGAGSVYLENFPGPNALKIEWIDMVSFANDMPTCMFTGAELKETGDLKGWGEFIPIDWLNRSMFTLKQDIKTLKEFGVIKSVDHIENSLKKHNLKGSDIDYFIPHVSSMFFYDKINEEICRRRLEIPLSKWFTNLQTVGNIGSASIYIALDEFLNSEIVKQGDCVLLFVPESGRFSFGTALLRKI